MILLNLTTTVFFNDLWRFKVNSSTWNWVFGRNNTTGSYGEKKNASPDHYPGARRYAVGWYDSIRKEFWLFGGFGFDGYLTRESAFAFVLALQTRS